MGTFFQGRSFYMPENNTKTEYIKLRVSSIEHQLIKDKAKAAKLNKSKFILKAVHQQPIIVIEGLKDVAYQLRKIGTNINQLSTLANQRQIIALELEDTKKELHHIWQSLNSLIEKTKNQSKS